MTAAAAWPRFLETMQRRDVPLVGNARVEVHAVALAGELSPVVVNTGRTADATWIASLRNTYGPYARAEARAAKLSAVARLGGMAASCAGEALLASGGFSGGCYLDSWLVATELHAPQLTSAAVLAVLDDVIRLAPGEPIIVRSLTPLLHRELIAGLSRAGFVLLPTRQIWLVQDPARGAWRQHRDSASDLRLVEATASDWRWITADEFTEEDFRQAHALYQQLYRQRYPRFNPDYTVDYFRSAAASGWLDLQGLREAAGGPLRAIIGMIHRGGVSATPLLGYHLSAPRELALYRRASLRIWQEAERRGTILHCSAGAGAFKESRGADPFVEFAAVWAGHLSRSRQAALGALAAPLQRWAVPYMEKHVL